MQHGGAGALSNRVEFEKRCEVINSFVLGQIETVILTNGFVRAVATPNLKALIVLEIPSFLVNETVCFDSNAYLQNMGRVGRSGQNAIVFNLVTNEEAYGLSKIQLGLGIQSLNL